MGQRKKIIILDDEKLYGMALGEMLSTHGDVTITNTKKEALHLLNKQIFDLAFIDLNLDENLDGLDVVKASAEKNVYTVVLSGYDDDDVIEKAYQYGCQDFFEKGNEQESIENVMEKFFLHNNTSSFDTFIKNDFITQDKATIEELKFIFNNSSGPIPVFLSGPTGTGKTTLASLIHESSGKNGNFVQFNCAEINPNLIESELFGHKKGAFTGAINNKTGRIKQADNGTLFLDEICSIPMETQTKLLKIIEEKSFYPVGSDKPESSNFRIICAAQDNVFDKIQTGEFRQDLYYRISGINMRLRPLNERKDDIPLIINKLLKNSSRRIIIKPEAKTILKNYIWPGNVRELIKITELLKLKNKGIIEATDLPPHVISNTKATNNEAPLSDQLLQYSLEHGLRKLVYNVENEIINRVLKNNNNGVLATLRDLKISRSKFYKIIS